MTSTRSLTLTTAMRVVNRVHRDTAVRWADTLPAVAPGLADGHVLVIGIAYLANRRHAVHQHLARFTGRQLQQRIVAFLGHQLRRRSSRAHHLRALARTKLNIVHRGTSRDVLERQR